MSHNPYTIKIELVRGCTIRCPFCAIRTMDWKDEKWQFMTEVLYKKIVDDIAVFTPKVRIEFAERGEQSFHPKLVEFIRYMRVNVPKSQMTLISNGDYYKKNKSSFTAWVDSLFTAGLNFLMFDNYDAERFEEFKTLFPDAKLFYDDNVNPYHYVGPKEKCIILVDGECKDNVGIRRYHNAAGSVDVQFARNAGFDINTTDKPLNSMCTHPFREIEIHYNGIVPLCCLDWKEDAIIGDVNVTKLEDIWKSMDPYRKLLLEHKRSD